MTPIPYIFFKDSCAEALAHYASVLGAEPPQIMRFSDMPPDAREGMDAPADSVMHAALKVGDGFIYASDDPSGETPAMAGCNVHLSFPDFEAGKAAFEALAEGGEVRMPFEPVFWSPGFGALTDRFGIRWMIDVDAPAPG